MCPRWIFQGHQVHPHTPHTWFILHLACQLGGLALFAVGLAYAWRYFSPYPLTRTTGATPLAQVGMAHGTMGVLVLSLVGLQVRGSAG